MTCPTNGEATADEHSNFINSIRQKQRRQTQAANAAEQADHGKHRSLRCVYEQANRC